MMGNETAAPLLAGTVITEMTSPEMLFVTLLLLLFMFFQSGDALSFR